MFSLIYLICIGGDCNALGIEKPYKSLGDCHNEAVLVIEKISKAVQQGELQAHDVEYQCVSWNKV